MKKFHAVQASQDRWINLDIIAKSFICKEVALSELSLLRFAYYYHKLSSLFPVLRLACSLTTTDKPIYATA